MSDKGFWGTSIVEDAECLREQLLRNRYFSWKADLRAVGRNDEANITFEEWRKTYPLDPS